MLVIRRARAEENAGTDRVAVDFREVCRRTVENAAQVETGGFRHAGTSITRYTS
jgi:hypothetical protein